MYEELDEEKTTTIRVGKKLWKEVKMAAIKHEMTVSGIVQEGIKLWLKENEEKKTDEKEE